MTTENRTTRFHTMWRTVFCWGVMTLILGVAVLVWPAISIQVASVLFGVFLVLSGIAQVLLAFTLRVLAASRVSLFVIGALSLVLGVLAFRYFQQGYATWLLAIWIGVAFVMSGAAEIAMATEERDVPDRNWITCIGALSVIAGVVVLLWPFDSISVLAVVVGVWLVIVGSAEVAWALRARRAIHVAEQERAREASTCRHWQPPTSGSTQQAPGRSG